MRNRNSYEECMSELALMQKENPAKSFANASMQIRKLSRRMRRLLDLLHFHQEMCNLDVRLVVQGIRDASKRTRALLDKAKSHA